MDITKNIKSEATLFVLTFLASLFLFYSPVYARQYEPGDFVYGSVGDKTGGLRTEVIIYGPTANEIRFIDVETGKIVYSTIYDNSARYIDYFSPDGKTLYLYLERRDSILPRSIELIDIYNSRKMFYHYYFDEIPSVSFSRCSNIALVSIYDYWGPYLGWNIFCHIIDLKAPSDRNPTIGSCTFFSKCAPPYVSITQDRKNVRVWVCEGDREYIFHLPTYSIPNDPEPPMPPVTIIPEGIIDSINAAQLFRNLTSLATQVLSRAIQPTTFPIIKFAVRVIGANKRPIFGLSSGNFQVKEDGVAQSPITVESQNTEIPVSIALCLDISGSISDATLVQINAAANKFIDLFGSADRGAIFKFSTNVYLIQGFTLDKTILKNAINASPPQRNWTSLYDAIYDAMNLCRQETNRKAVVALTDGYDNDSSHNLQQVTDFSAANKIPVFTIGLGSPLNVNLLQQIANNCGGIYFNAASTDKLEEVFNKVAEDIRSRYIITYTTNNPKKDGTNRTILTTVNSGGNSASCTIQYRAPQGQKPTAQIVSIAPNPARKGQTVTLKGIGTDSDGTIAEYSWRSSLDGIIGNQEVIQLSNLSEGEHTIYFEVRDNDGLWSDEVSVSLSIHNKIVISGKIRYENLIFNEIGTGDITAKEFKSVRFADIKIIRASDGSVLGSSETDENGDYLCEADIKQGELFLLRCYTQQENNDYNIIVKSDAMSVHYIDSPTIAASQEAITINLDIPEASNKGGAFNIFDGLIESNKRLKETGITVVPPLITVYWQKEVERATGYTYRYNSIDINGATDDPDEYDDSVILHEYGHFIMHIYSYDKSSGGHHSVVDINQDIRLSFSEGWATYFSSLMRKNPLYVDVIKNSQTGQYVASATNIENLLDTEYGSLIPIATGQDTEVAVAAILWDIFDNPLGDDDPLGLGSQYIWNVFDNYITNDMDCVLEDFYQGWFNQNGTNFYKTEVNNIFASRSVLYSTPSFTRGPIFTKIDGSLVPDGTGQSLNSRLNVPDNLFIGNMNVFVDLPHKYKSDLLVSLISPSGKEVILHNHTYPLGGQSEDIFAWYQPPYETIPAESLDNFKGEISQGEWILKINDPSNHELMEDNGWLNRWKIEVIPNNPPQVGTVTPASGESKINEKVAFTTTYVDPDGWQDINSAFLLINNTSNGKNCFFGYYDRNSNKLYLRNDDDSVWMGGYTPGSTNIIENSYAKIDCSQTTVSKFGLVLIVNWQVIFKSTFVGGKNIYLYVKDNNNAYDGWVQKGTWLIKSNPPTIGTITPFSGSSKPNNAVTFTTTFIDLDGWQDIQEVKLLINAWVSPKSLFTYYDQNTNKLYLRDDANTTWLGGFKPGERKTIENTFAKLDCSKTAVSGSGNTLTVKWSITFKTAFVETKTKYLYLYVKDDAGLESGWERKGTWLVGSNSKPSVGTINPSSGTSKANQTVTFTTTYTEPNGWQDIQEARLLINTSTSGKKCLYVYYNQNTNKLYLRNDADTAWIGGISPGSSNIIENSYAKLDCANTSVSRLNDNTLTIAWSVIFKPSFIGTKKSYLYVKDDSNTYNGFIQKGTWTVNP